MSKAEQIRLAIKLLDAADGLIQKALAADQSYEYHNAIDSLVEDLECEAGAVS